MKSLVLEEKNARQLLLEFAVAGSKRIGKNSLLAVRCLWQGTSLLAWGLFVPVTHYRCEGTEELPVEVNLREEYQKFQIPRGPFC
jgi:hypothetical protein